MTDATEIADAAPAAKPKGKLGLILGLAAALVLGGGHEETPAPSALADVAFVAMDPIMISLPPGSEAKHLRFAGQLEVAPDRAAEVAGLMPRVLDVLNTYLRAVEVRDLEEPAALARLRAQMLRRIQVVTGEGRVRDLLVTEFVLN